MKVDNASVSTGAQSLALQRKVLAAASCGEVFADNVASGGIARRLEANADAR